MKRWFLFVIQCAIYTVLCVDLQDEDTNKLETAEAVESGSTTDLPGQAKINGFILDDSSWKIVWHGSSDVELLDAPDMESVLMLTKDNEQYNCRMESSKGFTQEDAATYSGANALQLMEPLFNKMACSYRLESYWTYEVCHGDFVRQYHEAKEGKQTKLIEYYLGRYSKEHLQTQIVALDAAIADGTAPKHPKKLRLEEVDLPYLEVVYGDGTVCDLTGKARETLVRYVCHMTGRHELVSFQEISSCQYVIVVLSPLLCAHPEYRVAADVENNIHCIALSNSPKRPRSMLELEAESLTLRHHLTVREVIEVELEPAAEQAEPRPAADQADQADQAEPPTSQASPVYDQKLVDDFLAGRHCLNGGTGWWRYEFCYGRHVLQYHVHPDSTRTDVTLGVFNVDDHRAWLRSNPQKRPKLAAARRHVSHFYSDGATCDEIGAPRSVEVKLKCKMSDSPNAVSLYLLEPRTCEYILGVESPIICGLMDSADDDGLFDR